MQMDGAVTCSHISALRRFFTATTSTTRRSLLYSHSLFKNQFVPCCDDDCCEFVESSTSAAMSGSCATAALCTGMCVSRKFLDPRARNARAAIFYPRASTKFPQLIETIFTACDHGGSAVARCHNKQLQEILPVFYGLCS